MKRLFLLTFVVLIGLNLQAQRVLCDDTCELADAPPESGLAPKIHVKEDPSCAVVCPVGRSSVEMIEQAPRLETLDGKTIAVVGVSFMTSVTHPEIKRLILENHPSAKVILLDEIGIAGPYPAPGVTRKAPPPARNCPLSAGTPLP